MKRLIYFCIFSYGLAIAGIAQSNLIPFGDFEGVIPVNPPNINVVCNNASFEFQSPTVSWTQLGLGAGAPNLFSADNLECQSAFGVPDNDWGTQHPVGEISSNRNYVGLQSTSFERDGLKVKLKHKLLSGHQYTLRFDAVKKSNFDPEVEFRIGKDDGWDQGNCPGCSQAFMTIGTNGGPNNDQWQNYAVTFIPDDCDYEWLMIRLQLNPGTRRMLIDNISIDDPCGAPYICSDGYGSLDNITVNELHNGNQALTFYHLENVESFHLTINNNSGQPVRTIFLPFPPPTYEFDGLNENGVPLPHGGYTYTVYANNPCQCFQKIENNFTISGTPPLMAFVRFDQAYEAITAYRLNNVTRLEMKIKETDGDEVRVIEVINPADQVAWDCRNSFGDFVAEAWYICEVFTESPCGNRYISATFYQIALTQLSPVSPFVDYTSHPKVIDCTEFSYDEAPPACCGFIVDWYIQDKYISGQQDYKINHDIVAVQNNVVETGSDVYFQAGNEIILNPEFEVEFGAEFEAVILPCTGRLMNPNLVEADNESDSTREIIAVDKSPESKIIPNPNTGEFILELDDLVGDVVVISITDLLGRVVYTEQISNPASGKMQVLIDISALGSGIYSCSVKEGDELVAVHKIIVQ